MLDTTGCTCTLNDSSSEFRKSKFRISAQPEHIDLAETKKGKKGRGKGEKYMHDSFHQNNNNNFNIIENELMRSIYIMNL